MSRNGRNPAKLRPARKTSAAPLHDKQSERDTRELRIDKVGVRGLRFPIQVRDKARSIQNTVATIGMFVDLPKEFKGTHMSRFVEVLNAHGSIIHVENIRDILLSLQKKLEGAIRAALDSFNPKLPPIPSKANSFLAALYDNWSDLYVIDPTTSARSAHYYLFACAPHDDSVSRPLDGVVEAQFRDSIAQVRQP